MKIYRGVMPAVIIGLYVFMYPALVPAADLFYDAEIKAIYEDNVVGLLAGEPGAAQASLNVLQAGASLYPLDALRRSSPRRIPAVIPYFGYARQDRKVGSRTPISAKLVANLITEAGADRVLTVDLHAGQIQGFFDIPTDNLYAAPVIVKDILDYLGEDNLMVVSPDVGGVVRARALAKRLGADLAIVDKRRERAGESEVMNIIGDVTGRSCILFDDIVDSGGTICNAAEALIAKGAKDVCAYATHGVLSGGAVARIAASKLKSMVVTDSIAATDEMRKCANIRRISIAPLIGEAMRRKPFLWDNYPVNDGPRMSQFLHLRAFTGRGAAIAAFCLEEIRLEAHYLGRSDSLLVMHGASEHVTDSDPFMHTGQPVLEVAALQSAPDPDRARETARALNAYLRWTHAVLSAHPTNRRRAARGERLGRRERRPPPPHRLGPEGLVDLRGDHRSDQLRVRHLYVHPRLARRCTRPERRPRPLHLERQGALRASGDRHRVRQMGHRRRPHERAVRRPAGGRGRAPRPLPPA